MVLKLVGSTLGRAGYKSDALRERYTADRLSLEETAHRYLTRKAA